jgi:predicted dinucleotide-binding enzyme
MDSNAGRTHFVKAGPMSSLSIAVIGSGVIGTTLGRRFAQAGHRVTFGARDVANAELVKTAEEIGAAVASVDAAIDGSEVVLWAIPGAAMAEAIPAVATGLAGKIVIDATNKVGEGDLNSLDVIARYVPSARAYRAFNTVGWENFADPKYGDVVGDLVFCGPDGDPRETVEQVIGATGLRPVYVGDGGKAGVVDGVAALWFALAFERGMGRGVGFKILTR